MAANWRRGATAAHGAVKPMACLLLYSIHRNVDVAGGCCVATSVAPGSLGEICAIRKTATSIRSACSPLRVQSVYGRLHLDGYWPGQP